MGYIWWPPLFCCPFALGEILLLVSVCGCVPHKESFWMILSVLYHVDSFPDMRILAPLCCTMVIPSFSNMRTSAVCHTVHNVFQSFFELCFQLVANLQAQIYNNLVESSTSPAFIIYHPVVQNHPVGFVPFVWPVYLWPANSPSPKQKHSLTRAKIQTLNSWEFTPG